MSVMVFVTAAVSGTAVLAVSLTALGLLRRARLRRHLHRLRTFPLETSRRS